MTAHPAYGEPRKVAEFATVLLQHNPNMMTLEGTNSWVLRADAADRCVVVDPGEDGDEAHVSRLVELAGPVELVLVTHHHHDHYGAVEAFADRVGAPVRAFDPALCRGAEPLAGGETVAAAGLRFEVLHTPGHTDDSISLAVRGAETTAVLTGDTILGRGTTVIHRLGDYLGSLRTLADTSGQAIGLPGHGPELTDVAATAREYLDHREQRLDQVREALAVLGQEASARQVVEHVYVDVDPSLWPVAEHSVSAQLAYLRGTE